MELDSSAIMKLTGFGVMVFITGYFIAKLHRMSKYLLFVCLLGILYEYYHTFDEIYYLVWLGCYILIMLAYMGETPIITIAKHCVSDETPLLKKLILWDRLFVAFGFAIVYSCVLHIGFYTTMDSYFTYVLPISILALGGLIADCRKLKNIPKIIKNELVELKSSKLYTHIYAIYEACEITDKDKDKNYKKSFIDEIMYAKQANGEIVEVKLLGVFYYFNPDKFDNLVMALEGFIQANIKISHKQLSKTLSKDLKLDVESIGDLLLFCPNVGKYCFTDTFYYVHNSHLDKFRFCACCSGAQDVNDENDVADEWFCSAICKNIEQACIELSDTINPVILKNESLEEYYHRRDAADRSNLFASITATLGVAEVWAKNYQAISSQTTGHGFAAEIMNHENDVWAGKDAKIIGGDNIKNGADRIVDGVKIQSKYCRSSGKTINQAFDNQGDGNYRYIGNDGKPMVLEVPRDQYEACIQKMDQKIRDGKVPGVSDPQEAKNLIKKGSATYQEAQNYRKFCTKESLSYDARNGTITAVGAFSVSFVINASICYYRERDIKKALQESVIIGIVTGGKAFAVYMLGAQAQRIPMIKSFLDSAINISFKDGSNVARTLAGAAGKQGGKGAVNSAANNALRGTMVTAAATMAVTSSIEIVQMMRGQISGMQCVKNIAVNAGGIAGGAAGAIAGAAALSFIPGVGTLVGGLAGGVIGGMGGGVAVKKLMDNFIEDDVAKKQRIFFDQMIRLSVMFKLSQEEGQILKEKIDTLMQASEDFFEKQFNTTYILPFANGILKPIVIEIVSNRPKLPPQALELNVIAGAISQNLRDA